MAYRILHCLSRMNRGGAETLIMNIFRHIDRRQYNFTFLLNESAGDYLEEIKRLGGNIYTLPYRSDGFFAYCDAVNNFFKDHKGDFDAVHLHTSSLSSLEILYYAKKYGVKKRIIHSHNTKQDGFVHNALHLLNKPFLHLLATDYLACSKVASDWLYKCTGVASNSIIINNGVDLELFKFNEDYRSEIRREYNIAEDTIVIGHVGRFDKVKNHSFLIDIFNSFQRIESNSMLICIGVGSTINDVKDKVHEYGIQDKVVFAGLRDDVYKFLSAFDYFVFPSLYEGLPVALVEAQASGLMTVCSNKVSSEVRLSDYLSQYDLAASADDWAKYIVNLPALDRKQYVYQLTNCGYNINETVNFLTENIYV